MLGCVTRKEETKRTQVKPRQHTVVRNQKISEMDKHHVSDTVVALLGLACFGVWACTVCDTFRHLPPIGLCVLPPALNSVCCDTNNSASTFKCCEGNYLTVHSGMLSGHVWEGRRITSQSCGGWGSSGGESFRSSSHSSDSFICRGDVTTSGEQVTRLVEKEKFLVDDKDDSGRTPFFLACK